jgi:hypothetical protein
VFKLFTYFLIFQLSLFNLIAFLQRTVLSTEMQSQLDSRQQRVMALEAVMEECFGVATDLAGALTR